MVFHRFHSVVLCLAVAASVVPGEENPRSHSSGPRVIDYGKYVRFFGSSTGYQGNVDYAWVKKHHASLDTFIADIARLERSAYQSWPEDDRVAFWINVFNALAVRVVIDHYPPRRIVAKSGNSANRPGRIQRAVDRTRFRVMGENMTIPWIRDQILRKEFGDPRVHMLLVAGANGYPPLPPLPYRGESLKDWLRFQSARVLSDTTVLQIDSVHKKIRLSPLFLWYAGDFVKMYGTDTIFRERTAAERAVLNFIVQNVRPGPGRHYILGGNYSIEYLDFDWSLNDAIEPVKRL